MRACKLAIIAACAGTACGGSGSGGRDAGAPIDAARVVPDAHALTAEDVEALKESASEQFAQARHDVAAAQFLAAYRAESAIDPDAAFVTLLNAAISFRANGHPLQARKLIDEADRLQTPRSDTTAEQLTLVRDKLATLVGELQLVPMPPRARVRIDGRVLTPAADGRLMVEAGIHELELELEDGRSLLAVFAVVGGGPTIVSVH